MSAFYDLASLVLVPSGYKSGKVYAQKPLTTDGQLAFTRASTATRVNASGLIEAVASGLPRLDYLGSTCPKLLLEPQRVNLSRYSEQLDNAVWPVAGCSVTANANVSPDGTLNADYIVENSAASTQHRIQTTLFGGTNAIHTISVFIKQGTGNRSAYIDLGPFYCYYNFTTGVITATGGTASVKNYGNGWYRLILTSTAALTPTTFYIGLASGTSETYSGNGTSSISFWGAQVEAGSYATSYIPTLSAAVTRVADVCSKTGITSLIGQTEGTLFLDFQFNGTQESIMMDISATGLSPQNRIILYNAGNNTINLVIFTASVSQVNIISPVYSVGQRIKVGVGYKTNDFAFYINGVQIGTDSAGAIPATSRIDIGNRQDGAYLSPISVNQTLLFTTRLTNAQLAELTTI